MKKVIVLLLIVLCICGVYGRASALTCYENPIGGQLPTNEEFYAKVNGRWYKAYYNWHVTGTYLSGDGWAVTTSNLEYTIPAVERWGYDKRATYNIGEVPADCTEIEPSYCSNGVKDEDEIGIDCGGSCFDSCSYYCPVGSEVRSVEGTGLYTCVETATPDSLGNCPVGYSLQGGECLQITQVEPTLAGPEYSSPADPTPGSGEWEAGTFSVVEFESDETVSNNGDGTSTGVQTITSTDGDGNTTTTTITTDYSGEDGTGSVTGTLTEVEGEVPAEENPENYKFTVDNPSYDGEISSEDIPDKESITDLLENMISSNPLATTITGSGVDLSSPVSQLTWDYKGRTVVFDLSDRSDVLSTIGTILVFLSCISSYFIIVGRA